MKNNRIKKGKQLQEQPEEKTLEKEIDELIEREKAKRKIVSKLVHPSHPNIEITNN